ncbi:hypothetical protein [Rhizohabitans arisaemae]|uniref:hypothetical protein n=1 Tax=Rhizohabitans arisaemae TaxID=2720610 RepID=UPI0024B238B9|nr:hypothetical protein [Rhizohabitans arisaemae]
MRHALIRRLAPLAAVAVITLTAGCSVADKVATCTAATQALTEFTSKAGGAATDPAAFNKAATDLGTKLEDLGAKTSDSALKEVLTDVGASWKKINISDPAGAAAEITKIQESSQKLATACGS